MLSSISARAVCRAPYGHRVVSAVLSSTTGVTCTESRTSQLLAPLPGEFREPTELWHNHNSGEASVVQTMQNENDLTELLASAKPNNLVVVKFHAELCNASKAIEGKFEDTASEFASMTGRGDDVRFAQVDFDSNRHLCQKMGIRSVPHVQIFCGVNGKIADFSIAPLKFNTLTSLLAERRDSSTD